jgi:NitT/TauT family transport system substrate-binding protein
MKGFAKFTAGLVGLMLLAGVAMPASAEVNQLRVSKGYGIAYLPFMVMEHDHLLQKHLKAAGLGNTKVSWVTLDGGNNINDAMLSGALDFASIGVPGFVMLWDRTLHTPREIRGVAAVGESAGYLDTRNPKIKSLKDFTDKDRIAVPGIKTSAVAMLLEMGAEQAFGTANYAKLDKLTVALPHPDATIALLSGSGAIDTHFASPPFSYVERSHPGIHTVINSNQILGGPNTFIMAYATQHFHDANPKTYKAFLGALQEAIQKINHDHRTAAATYISMRKGKFTATDIRKMLDDPANGYTLTPRRVMGYVGFMERTKLIKHKPASWKDLFFPEIHQLHGS